MQVSTKEQRRAEWARRGKHFFILSDAGKPIFSRWGDEQELATFMGVLQVRCAPARSYPCAHCAAVLCSPL